MATKTPVSLMCAIVGTPRFVCVDPDADELIAELRAKIAAAAGLNAAPSSIDLYRAKQNGQADGERMTCTGEVSKMLQSDSKETTSTFLKRELWLNPMMRVGQCFDAQQHAVGAIDVLVHVRAPTLRLLCVVAGRPEVLWVPIDANLPVARLKAAILKLQPFHSVDWSESAIDLYLAKQDGEVDGEWMPHNRDVLAGLQHAPLSDDVERKYLSSKLRLDPTRAVGDYFPSSKFMRHGVVHVVVDVPMGCTMSLATGKKTYIHSEGTVSGGVLRGTAAIPPMLHQY